MSPDKTIAAMRTANHHVEVVDPPSLDPRHGQWNYHLRTYIVDELLAFVKFSQDDIGLLPPSVGRSRKPYLHAQRKFNS